MSERFAVWEGEALAELIAVRLGRSLALPTIDLSAVMQFTR
jgi:hypothetical protein